MFADRCTWLGTVFDYCADHGTADAAVPVFDGKADVAQRNSAVFWWALDEYLADAYVLLCIHF